MKVYLKKLITPKNIIIWTGALFAMIFLMIALLGTKVELTTFKDYWAGRGDYDNMIFTTKSYWRFAFDGKIKLPSYDDSFYKAPFIRAESACVLCLGFFDCLALILIQFIPNDNSSIRKLKMFLSIILAVALLVFIIWGFVVTDDPDFDKPYRKATQFLTNQEILEQHIVKPYVDVDYNFKNLFAPALISQIVAFVGTVFGGYKVNTKATQN